MIPNVTTPPRHQSKILTPTRRTAGHPLLAAKVGATRVGKPVGRVAILDKLRLHLLELLELLEPLDPLVLLDLLERLLHQQRTVALQVVVKAPARAAEVRAAVRKVGRISSTPTPPPFQDSPAPTTQEQVKEAGRISSVPTPPPFRDSPVPAAQEQVKEVGRISSIPTTPLRKSPRRRAAPSRIRATTPPTNKRCWRSTQSPLCG